MARATTSSDSLLISSPSKLKQPHRKQQSPKHKSVCFAHDANGEVLCTSKLLPRPVPDQRWVKSDEIQQTLRAIQQEYQEVRKQPEFEALAASITSLYDSCCNHEEVVNPPCISSESFSLYILPNLAQNRVSSRRRGIRTIVALDQQLKSLHRNDRSIILAQASACLSQGARSFAHALARTSTAA